MKEEVEGEELEKATEGSERGGGVVMRRTWKTKSGERGWVRNESSNQLSSFQTCSLKPRRNGS